METNRALFSWSKNQLEYPEKTMEFLEEGKVTTIFQHITQQDSASSLRSFIAVAEEAEKQVYFLMGDPTWTFELDPLLQMIQIAETHQPQGIVIDVEPYLLDEFQTNPQEVMDAFVTNMKKAYQATELEVILCVPYFYDLMGFSKELEQLIAEAADAVAVMNYYR